MLVRDADEHDLPEIVEIVNALISTTTIEWTDTPHTLADRKLWLEQHRAGGEPVLVAEVGGVVAGFGNYGDFRDSKKWPGYRYTVEHTVHVRERAWRSGVGRALIDGLAQRAIAAGKRMMVAAIDGDNLGSIDFHAQCGFIKVADMPAVGWKHGHWLSLVLMQRDLQSVGVSRG